MKKLRQCFVVVVILGLLVGSLQRAQSASAAISEYEVDPDEYSLWVDEVPDGIYDSSYISAKLNKTNLNVENYTLSLIEDLDSMQVMQKAMTASGVSTSTNRVFAMDVILYEYDEEEGDYYPSEESKIGLICPIPDVFYDEDEEGEITINTDNIKVIGVSAGGRLTYPSFELVSVDEVICAKFNIDTYTPHGFIQPAPKATSTPVPTARATTTPAPTDKPTAAPTAKPTTKPTASPTRAATVTTAPAQNSGNKVNTPKTEDEHSSETMWIVGSACALTLLTVVVVSKKRQKRS